MKQEYLNNLRAYLKERQVKAEDIEDIIIDYNDMYEGYLEKGYTDQEIYEKLGKPSEVYKSIKGTVSYFISNTYKKNKIVALSPFIAVILFVVIGQITKVYHPTWLVFLLIPISGVLSGETNIGNKIVGLTPFISTVVFLVLGISFDIWHPTWLVFLLIPISSLLKNPIKNIVGLVLFLGIVASFLLTHFRILEWKYAWLLLILFLVVASLTEVRKSYKRLMWFIGFLIAVISYIILISNGYPVLVSLLPFLLPFVLSIYSEAVNIKIEIDRSKKAITLFVVTVVIFIAFLTLGIIFNNWAYIWQILLLVPIVAIIVNAKKDKLSWTALMPFISTIIFYNLGYFYDLWSISWLAYLLIPISAILDN